MIGDLEPVLATSGQPALPELRAALGRALGAEGAPVACVEEHSFKSRVFRLRFRVDGRSRSVVAKRLAPHVAARCEQLARNWLPAAGLGSAAPRLFAASPASGPWVWHVYEDLGEDVLERNPDDERVAAAVRLLARLHARFEGHPLLGTCRAVSQDLGISYFSVNVRDALQALESLAGHPSTRVVENAALRHRLLARLGRLLAEEPARARALAEGGGADTLLHGDLWITNVFVTRNGDGLVAQLLDWDHVGVGPASYDLSTFLLRFPRERRAGILDRYERDLAAEGGRPLDRRALALNFETAELSRYANRVIWPARAIVDDNADWGFPALAEVEEWFETMEPVLDPPAPPLAPSRAAAGARPEAPAPDAPPAERYLIVNADDFGATPGVNRGILAAHRAGIVTSTSLMVDGPAAREAAAASREAPALGIGLHVDLGRTPPATVDGVRVLLRRQAERFVELMGRRPTHLDSHRNSHLLPHALPAFLELAREWDIVLRGRSRVRLLLSFYGQWHGESHPEQVRVPSLLKMLATKVDPGITELICHPGHVEPELDSSYRFEREVELATLCDPEIRRAVAECHIQLVGFADLVRLPAE